MERVSQIIALIALFAPLASSICIQSIGRKSGRVISSLSLLWMTAAWLSAITLALRHWNSPQLISISWLRMGELSIDASLQLGHQSLSMLVVVSFISLLVHLYSITYMHGDPGWKNYFAMLGFFTFAMQGIVLTDNLLFLFIFWELVGFSSYMLIGHWTEKISAGAAASKAFIMNRIGDAGFLIGLMILWGAEETFSISSLLAGDISGGWGTAAGLCIFCGVIGKSAQFPLFTWLPDAMEGPTPVSALIHAATMVAAGVYLLVRLFPLFTPDALTVVAVIGAVTSLVGALAALSQYDLKKILAYSTMSQLGLMVLALGMGVPNAAFLHLLTHAFFKACLFLGAGSVIHAMQEAHHDNPDFDAQDIRNMGGLRHQLPTTWLAFSAGAASLSGLPFFSGFLSKEAILTSILEQDNTMAWLAIALVLVVSFLTVLYTFRMTWSVFFGNGNNATVSESGLAMRLPMIILGLFSLWFVVSPNPFSFTGLVIEFAPEHALWVTVLSLLWVLGAMTVAFLRRNRDNNSSLLRQAFYVDRTYQVLFGRGSRMVSELAANIDSRIIDRSIHGMAYAQVIGAHVVGWIDRAFIDGTVNAIARFVGFGGRFTRSFQGGNIQLYIFWSVFTIIIFIIWAAK